MGMSTKYYGIFQIEKVNRLLKVIKFGNCRINNSLNLFVYQYSFLVGKGCHFKFMAIL